MEPDRIRALFPGTRELVYFNAAAQSLLPGPVAERMQTVATRQCERGITAYPQDMQTVEAARAAAARLIGARTDDIAFTGSTVDGVARVAEGLDWREGDEVLLNDLEFPANVYPWAVQQRRGVRLRFVKSDAGRLETQRLIDAIGPRTRVLAISHVQFSTGYRVDLDALAGACRARGVLLFVDAIQSLGVVPLDVQQTPIDALAVDGRKWLMGPTGCGLLYVAPQWLERIRSSVVGARSVRDHDDLLQYRDWLDDAGRIDLESRLRVGAGRFEGGYPNVVGVAGLGAALELGEQIGRERIHRRIAALVARCVAKIEHAGLAVYGPRSAGERAGIVSFEVAGSAEAIFRRLHRDGYSTSARDGRLRLAPHVYNTEDEVDAVVARIASMQSSA
jgi:selenocysteine lyase/cysteine desulfurase